MKHSGKIWWLVGLAALLAMPSMAWAQAEQRPISDFIDAQEVGPPTTYTPWFDPKSSNWLFFDAFGTFNERFGLNLGTTFDGRLTVRRLPDGRAHVSVVLHTKNGVCWGYTGGTAPANLVFGNRPAIVAGGATPSIGEGITRLEFEMPSVGSPLPDYFAQLGTEDYPLMTLAATINCDGELRTASGYPDGTKGVAHTTQTGLYATGVPFPGGCPPEQDASCFPAEIVSFKPVGKR